MMSLGANERDEQGRTQTTFQNVVEKKTIRWHISVNLESGCFLPYDRTEVASEKSSFNTEDTNLKHTNILTIYNQYSIRNDLQKILQCQKAKLGFARTMSNDMGWNAKVWK
jgi:hypothetical protein